MSCYAQYTTYHDQNVHFIIHVSDHSCSSVYLRGKYEIHRVYVRSTARIYEIYYTTDHKDSSKDYLCTVRCGLAVKEPLPSAEESMTQWSSDADASTSEKHEQETKSVNSSLDEDSWVEVKIPELPVEKNRPKSQECNAIGARQETTLAHYEATAEITDASPCVSLTIRLLSLQSKTSVHIEEIYIFADPVETINDEPETCPGNMGGSSLLAMLVPSLMQMSKSRNQKTDNKCFSDASMTQFSHGCAMRLNSSCENIVQEAGPCHTNDLNFKSAVMENKQNVIDSDTITSENGNHCEFQLKDSKSFLLPVQTTENKQVPLVKNQRVSNTDQPVTPLMDENLNPYSRIDGKLDALLSKLEKMESYYSRFDDGMMRPLSSIESRLQRLEQKFDSFSVEIQSLRVSCARMSAPDGLSDMTNPQDKSHSDGKAGSSASATNRQPGLVIRAPEFSLEEYFSYDKSNENPVDLRGASMVPRPLVKSPDFVCESELTHEKLHDASFSSVDFALSSEKEYKTSPGLVVKVPEFLNDEDDKVDEKKETEFSDHDDGHTKSDDAPSKSTVDSSKSKTDVSVDGALASALAALLNSTKQTSCSQSVACPASNPTAENTNDSSAYSFSPEQVDEISTKDGSADQFYGTFGDANNIDNFISYQEADADPHTSLSKANLDEKVEENGQNNDLNFNMMAFVSSTEPLCVSSQLHTVEESIDVGSQENQQNDGSNSGVMSSVAKTEHIVAPHSPTVLKYIDDGAQLNANKSTLSLTEFLVTRNANSCKNVISETFSGNEGAETHIFKRTSAGSAKNLMDTNQILLVKKALENADGSAMFSVSGGMDFYCDCNFTDSNRRWTESSSLEASPNDNFTKPEVEHSWSDFSTESFIIEPTREAIVSGDDMAESPVDYLFTFNSSVKPTAGDEYKDDMLGMTFLVKRTSKNSHSLEVLLAESSDSEGEISDAEDTENDVGFGSAQFSTLSSSDDEAAASDEPLVDVVNLPTPSEAYVSSRNELFDMVDLTNPSGTHGPAENEPLDNVVGLLNPSETCSVISEHPVDDQSKPSGTFAGDGSGEYPDSLI
ncbi:hypothetical protein GUJ93_ZPchr0013g36262 [Zizania palustris]|uniref:Uncharacterized protein n=1 Tax=Zizania palustris TaxID=103762 RepID=A0A8J6C172_ZIZPA|nr:hypothetical protein GUJ93_ZPchr0013g36262 [Zizania palustris]KAG8099628.1 hypothetical protein GUJ93_ZPchr0013g36262 [Zizania palustris]